MGYSEQRISFHVYVEQYWDTIGFFFATLRYQLRIVLDTPRAVVIDLSKDSNERILARAVNHSDDRSAASINVPRRFYKRD